MVPEGGLEPPLPCGKWILNPSRLPIPPLRHSSHGHGSHHAGAHPSPAALLRLLPIRLLMKNSVAAAAGKVSPGLDEVSSFIGSARK